MLLLCLLFAALANPLKQLPGSCNGRLTDEHASLVLADTFQGEPALFFEVKQPFTYAVITDYGFYPSLFVYQFDEKQWLKLQRHAKKGRDLNLNQYQARHAEETYLFVAPGFLLRSCFVPARF